MSQHLDAVAKQSGFDALNGKIANQWFDDQTLSSFESELDSFCADLTSGEYRHIWVHITAASGVFASTNYTGFVECNLSGMRWRVTLYEQASYKTIVGWKTSSGWNWDSYVLDSNFNKHFLLLGTIPANGSKTYNIIGATNAILFTLGSATGRMSQISIYASGSSATPTVKQVYQDSGITVTPSAGSITLANDTATAANLFGIFFTGELSQ